VRLSAIHFGISDGADAGSMLRPPHNGNESDTMDIKQKIEILVKLQSIENETSQVEAQIQSVDRRIADLENERLSYATQVKTAESDLETMHKIYREHESDTQMLQAQIEKSEVKLRSVKTNKEYQSVLKEIDELKEKTSHIEDQMLEILERTEAVEAALDTQKKVYTQRSHDIEDLQQTIRQEAESARQALAQLSLKWQQTADHATPELIQQFNHIKQKVGPVAIAAVNQAVCSGCNLNIPPQMFNELQRFERLDHCPHCQRIIYSGQSLD
jgi:predicted  nucleic acid-binding Zn-ribbon protein